MPMTHDQMQQLIKDKLIDEPIQAAIDAGATKEMAVASLGIGFNSLFGREVVPKDEIIDLIADSVAENDADNS